RFVDELRAREPRLLLLRGRCHEQERVPYNALDAVVDGLGRFLAARSHERLQPLLPANLAPLGRLFPVLELVEPIARATEAETARPALTERGEAFAALRELLQRLGQRRPLCITIDDLQWADGDSLALLTELLRAPDAPPLLLV